MWGQVAGIYGQGLGSKSVGRRPGGRGGGSPAGSEVSRSVEPSNWAPASLPEPSQSRAAPETAAADGEHAVSPSNPNFTKLVLNPRAIFINPTNSIVPSAFSHFGTSEPLGGGTVGYSTTPGLEGGGNIWVMLDRLSVREITAECREMLCLDLCEEEFATFAKTHFLRGEMRSRGVPEDGRWRADRMLRLVCLPDETDHWHIPPLVAPNDFAVLTTRAKDQPDLWMRDIRPDCAYWLSLRGFNTQYRAQMRNCTFVRSWVTCPYLTVEFKRDGEPKDVATRTVCAAGAMALYNRWSLRAEAREASRRSHPHAVVDDKHGDDNGVHLRHYTLTFLRHEFAFWILQPTRDNAGRWAGCVMTRLFGADCTDEFAVRELAHWINEIHRWGLSRYGPSCERDIQSVLNWGGLRVSAAHGSG